MKAAIILLSLAIGAAPAAAMDLKSANLKDGGKIASEQVYTQCGGENISPQLSWSGAPEGTKWLALTVIDQSVKPNKFAHWVVIGIPASAASVPKGGPLPADAKARANDFGNVQYDGPCPPKGSGPHRYVFAVWALKAPPTIAPGANAGDIEAALDEAALDKATLTGTYERD